MKKTLFLLLFLVGQLGYAEMLPTFGKSIEFSKEDAAINYKNLQGKAVFISQPSHKNRKSLDFEVF